MTSLIYVALGIGIGLGAFFIIRILMVARDVEASPDSTMMLVAPVVPDVQPETEEDLPVADSNPTEPPPKSRPRVQSHDAVSVWPGSGACDSAREIRDIRFFLDDAPRLPLPDCNRKRCRCELQIHSDRRAGIDRRAAFSAYGFRETIESQNRRDKSDRRTDD